jgi:hypothetical protein
LNTALYQGFRVVIEHFEAVGGEGANSFERFVEDHIPVGRKHMRFGIVEFCNLGQEMEVFKGGAGRAGAVEVGVAEQPEFVGEGVEVGDDQFDRAGGLVAGGRKLAGDQVAMLERRPGMHHIPVQEGVGADVSLLGEEGVIFGREILERGGVQRM